MNKKIIVVTLIGALSLGLTACNGGSKLEPNTETETPETKTTETASTQTTQTPETKSTESTNEAVNLTKIDNDLKELMKGDDNYPSVREYEMKDIETGPTIQLIVERGQSEGEAQGLADSVHTQFNKLVKNYHPNNTAPTKVKIIVIEDTTNNTLVEKQY